MERLQSQCDGEEFHGEKSSLYGKADPSMDAQSSTSETIVTPSTPLRIRSVESLIWSCHMLSIVDMAWTALEVLMILLCLLPQEDIAWQVVVICASPNTIQFSAAILMFIKTAETVDFEKVYRCCQLWLFLAFVTILCNTAFIVWITVTDVITVFLIFVMTMKICWRFAVMFFVNEVHNELESEQVSMCESEPHSRLQIGYPYDVGTPAGSSDSLNLLDNGLICDAGTSECCVNDDSGTIENCSDNGNEDFDTTNSDKIKLIS